MSNRVLLAIIILLVAATAVSAGTVTYCIKELPSLPGAVGGRGAQAINEKGQIAGTMLTANKQDHAVIWDSDINIKDLGALPGDTVSWGLGINDLGQAVGWSAGAGNKHKHAVVWEADGKIRDLGTLGGEVSEARAINSRGWVVGVSTRKEGPKHAFLWKPESGITDLGSLGLESEATDIDDFGRVVGWSYDSSGYIHAVLWEPDGTMKDLGETLGMDASSAVSINASGRIAGKSGSTCGSGMAFLWDPKDGLTDLGLLKDLPRFSGFLDPPPVPMSTATALNDSGCVVGWSRGKDTQSHAFLWSRDTGMIDLGCLTLPSEQPKPDPDTRKAKTSKFLLGTSVVFGRGSGWSNVHDINNVGIIVGSSNGRAVVWTPLGR